jgi:23S rRNA (pseudouridine1915-N3)-methyltransferase
MKLKISAIGKLKSGPERELFQRYLTRSGGMANQLGFSAISLREFSESKNNSPEIRKQQEAEQLISTTNKGGILLAFDENGKDLTSTQFATMLATERDSGAGELVFALGGPDGLGAELLDKAKARLRFGKMTWPHQVARILLAEQIYRAMTILAGHPYHRQ